MMPSTTSTSKQIFLHKDSNCAFSSKAQILSTRLITELMHVAKARKHKHQTIKQHFLKP